jgi:DNA repair exonuclease SbcCD ATPase subunit
MASVSPIHSGTKATPQNVFAACRQLRTEQGEFRNEEVLAITGGGSGTVTRLVKLYRQHEHIVTANEALDAEVTITLVQALDQLLKQQLQRSQQATDDFMSGAGVEIAELSNALEQQEARNAALVNENDALRERVLALEAKQAKSELSLADTKRELAERDAQLTLKARELQHAQDVHTAKLEQLNCQHQTALAQALEEQRKAINEEHQQAVEGLKAEHQSSLTDANAQLDRLRVEKAQVIDAKEDLMAEMNAQRHDYDRKLTESQLALERVEAQAQERISGLESMIDEKQQAIDAVQRTHKQLQDTLRQQQSSNTDAVIEQLTTVSNATDSVNETLSELSNLLRDIQKAATETKLPPGQK